MSNTHWTPVELYYSTFKIYWRYSIKYFVDPPWDIIKSLLNYNSDLCKKYLGGTQVLMLPPSWGTIEPRLNSILASGCCCALVQLRLQSLLRSNLTPWHHSPCITWSQELTLNLWDHSSPNPYRRIGLVWISCFLFWQEKKSRTPMKSVIFGSSKANKKQGISKRHILQKLFSWRAA